MKSITFITIVSFLLHIVWENLQAPLFAGYVSFGQHFWFCLYGTAGDVVIALVVFLLIALLKGDMDWIRSITARDLLALAIIGFFIAVWIEHRALLFSTWNYAAAMPIIPYLKVGLTPVLQMVILLPLSFLITDRLLKKNRVMRDRE
ncbi:MAG: hypothetical protein HZB10_02295 [Candidatus Yonathbacteria bacterium]|nr:hypothetical protein [Candidatus Yonathbacteria bacterium]